METVKKRIEYEKEARDCIEKKKMKVTTEKINCRKKKISCEKF